MGKNTNTTNNRPNRRSRRRKSIKNLLSLSQSRTVSSLSEFFVMLQYETTEAGAYGGVLARCRRREEPGLGTMAVTVNSDGGFSLLYDPLFNDLVKDRNNWESVRKILLHEMVHLQMNHPGRSLAKYREEFDKKRFAKINPYSIDFTCNSSCVDWNIFTEETLLSSEPVIRGEDGVAVVDPLGRPVSKWRGVYPTEEPWKLPENLSYERYYKILSDIMDGKPPKEWESLGEGSQEDRLKECQERLNSSSGNKPYLHIEDFDLGNVSEEDIESMIQDCEIISESMSRSLLSELKSRGLGDGALASSISEKLAPPQVPWEFYLKSFVKKASLKKHKKKSIRNQNRRREDNGVWSPFPGKCKDKKVKALLCIDTSASVSDEEFNEIRNEVLGLHSLLGEVTVVYCDTKVQKVETLTEGSRMPSQAWGRGGTSFDPAFKWAIDNSFRPDIIIYGTDGECPLPKEENRISCPVMWLVTSRGCLPGGDWDPKSLSPGEMKPTGYGVAVKLNKVL